MAILRKIKATIKWYGYDRLSNADRQILYSIVAKGAEEATTELKIKDAGREFFDAGRKFNPNTGLDLETPDLEIPDLEIDTDNLPNTDFNPDINYGK